MKIRFNTIIVIIVIVSYASLCSGQKLKQTQVPKPNPAAFAIKFPHAEGIKWELEKKDEYEANFSEMNVKSSANFDSKGILLETETVIPKDDLPSSIQSTLVSLYSECTIKDIEKITHSNSSVEFEVTLNKGNKNKEILFHPDGSLVKKGKEEGKKK